MRTYDDPPARLARAMRLSASIRCSDPLHNVDLDGVDMSYDLLNWIRYGSGWGRPWITRIGGDSANGYEYTCSMCTHRLDLADRLVWNEATNSYELRS